MSLATEKNTRLVGIIGPLKGKTLPIREEELAIGREPGNALWAADCAMSRRHCLIQCQDGVVTIQDLGGRNGTFVNGARVEKRELQNGDQVSIGASVLIFLRAHDDFEGDSRVVELSETEEFSVPPMVLRAEDALYLQPDRLLAATAEADRVTRDLNTLLKIANGIGSIRDREALEWQLLGMIFDVVPADRGAILQIKSDDENFESAVVWDRILGPKEAVRVSRTIVQRVLRERAGLVLNDIDMSSDVEMSSSVSGVYTLKQARVKSLLCVPIFEVGVPTGIIYLDRRDRMQPFGSNHLEFMTGVAKLVGLALENIRHVEGLQEENQRLRTEIELNHDMVGSSPKIREILGVIRRVAPTSSTVLIQGESGTGKELVARAIHRNSPRSECPFVAINCAALTESLLESELFGYEKGAFTGAVGQKKGKIEAAEGGTLFLDEISELALGLQAKLLRVLQEREFERVGGTRPIKVDVRVIAATNKSLAEASQAGSFRSDLFYRLNVVSITTPALRDRREDIPVLAESFLRKFSKKCNVRKKGICADAQTLLMRYDWPGNVRELENAIERAVVLGVADEVLPEDLPDSIAETASPATSGTKYYGCLKENKKQLVLQALEQANGYYVDAAKILGLHPNSLLRLIRNLGLKANKQGLSPNAAD